MRLLQFICFSVYNNDNNELKIMVFSMSKPAKDNDGDKTKTLSLKNQYNRHWMFIYKGIKKALDEGSENETIAIDIIELDSY